MRKKYFFGAAVLVTVAVTVAAVTHDRAPTMRVTQKPASAVAASYSLKLRANTKFSPGAPQQLSFTIANASGKTYKKFDAAQPYQLNLIAIRKDRTQYQHFYPKYDARSGVFTVDSFSLPTDGAYRIYASFGAIGNEPDTYAPYIDVNVGDLAKYTPVETRSEKFMSSSNGFDATMFFSNDDSAGKPATTFNGGHENTISITVDKDHVRFKSFDNFGGSLGRLTLIGPKLDFVQVNATPALSREQIGLIFFDLTIPGDGLYRLFLQTTVNGQVTTHDFTVTVIPTTNK